MIRTGLQSRIKLNNVGFKQSGIYRELGLVSSSKEPKSCRAQWRTCFMIDGAASGVTRRRHDVSFHLLK
jgi:hypothetical protein